MTFLNKLEEAYKTQSWDEVAQVLDMLGVSVTPVSETTDLLPKSKRRKVKAEVVVAPEPPKPAESFQIQHERKQDGWEEIPKRRTNTFIDTKEDMKSGPYRPQYKGKRPKGVKAEYPSYDAYLQDVMYSKEAAPKTTRPPVTKIKISCDQCKQVVEEYPSLITYSDPETRRFICNECCKLK